jgi:hypothetical protein
MTEHDPLDEVLRRAFAEDRVRGSGPSVAAPVMRRIRAQRRLRRAVLAAAGLAGLLLLATVSPGALAAAASAVAGALLIPVQIIASLAPDALPGLSRLETWVQSAPAIALLVILGAGSVLVLADDGL